MKILYLVRHAKSSWDSPTQNDFDRPLNARGIKDAPVMARRLLKRNMKIDAFISSPAVRAKQTCFAFMEVFEKEESQIQLQSQLYLAEPEVLAQAIARIPEDVSSAAVFSHNNGLTDYANTLTNARVDNMPTCSIFAVKAEVDNWKDFAKAKKEFLFFDYPKLQS